MQGVERNQYVIAHSLFSELAEFNLSVEAVLLGTAPGELYVDDPGNPRVAFVATPEGHYLAGDAELVNSYPALKEVIPFHAYLTFDPQEWEAKVGQIWMNRAVRPHPRYHMLLRSLRMFDWQRQMPEGFRVVQVDASFLAQRDLRNHDVVLDRIGSWHSHDYFLQHGFGFCVIDGDTIASCCIADCVVNDRCEMGIATDIRYRRRGLAALVAAVTVDYCLAQGFTQIGWHCLQSNAGSIAVAKKVGFIKERAYIAYGSVLPTENVADMTPAEYEEWARHYEQFIVENFVFGYDAARAWALAGNQARALSHLQQVIAMGWRGRPERLADNWVFASLRGHDEFEEMIAYLRQETDNGGE